MQGKKKRDAEAAETNRQALIEEGKYSLAEEDPNFDDAPRNLLEDKDEDIIF